MADNTYSVPPNFPVGVLLFQLRIEMLTVWPLDVFPLSMIYRNGAVPGGVITTGNITIVTQRVITVPEDDAALLHFQTHVPLLNAGGGILLALLALTPGNFNGDTAYCNDQPRTPPNTGTGALCVWNGNDRTWRRLTDDDIIVSVP